MRMTVWEFYSVSKSRRKHQEMAEETLVYNSNPNRDLKSHFVNCFSTMCHCDPAVGQAAMGPSRKKIETE